MARRPDQHATLSEDSPPLLGGNPLFCHQEFLEKMEENRANTVGRRAALLLQRLFVDLRRQYYKPTQGDNRGWRRSPLGGNHGSHFYAWWAPRGAAPLKAPEFESAPEGAIFLRDIRHHDDHRPLNPQSVAENYLPIGVKELRQEDYVPAPWTQAQAKFAEARQKVRIIKGFPGSGKTTALWHAADMAGRKSILYITYSPELAALARDHFDKFAPAGKRFHVVTFSEFLRQVTEIDSPFEPVRTVRQAFVKEISSFSPTILGPWSAEKAALYDEMHAHLFGALLPFPVGRFAGFPDRRITARQYRDLRERSIGRVAAEAVVEVCETLRRRDSRPVEARFFRELDLAWNAVQRIRSHGPGRFAGFDCIALDEAQDLTPIEALALVEVAAAVTGETPNLNLLVAGDEAQTVRPTDFEWGWFQDLIHFRLASPADFKLQTNLRSPRRIATLVNRVWDLYGAIAKSERPGGTGVAEIDDNAGDQVILCAAKSGPELDGLLEVFSEREGLALIAMGEEIPAYVPERLRDRILTTFEAKGLDFQSVCILDAGKWLDRVLQARDRGRGLELEDLSKRLAIDQLRVALSRPAERLYWLDVNPNDRILGHSENMLSTGGERAYPMVPAVLLKTLEEEALDAEERVRLCESDARQFLSVRPALAWSRARQAVALLGEAGGKFSVSDSAARDSAYLTLCQVAFTLAFRRVSLPSEMGRVDLYEEAAQSAARGRRQNLATLVREIGFQERNTAPASTIHRLGTFLAEHREHLEPWLLAEIQPRSAAWLELLESQVLFIPPMVLEMMPVLYGLFVPLQAEQRAAQLREKAIRVLMEAKVYVGALQILEKTPGADPRLIAECQEGRGELEEAAAEYWKAGRSADALRCYRLIPDFDKSLQLLDAVGKHPARESLLWLRRMRDLAAERPAEFQKVILPAEKQLLENVLQTALGVARKKPAAKKPKTAVKKTASPRKKKDEFF